MGRVTGWVFFPHPNLDQPADPSTGLSGWRHRQFFYTFLGLIDSLWKRARSAPVTFPVIQAAALGADTSLTAARGQDRKWPQTGKRGSFEAERRNASPLPIWDQGRPCLPVPLEDGMMTDGRNRPRPLDGGQIV